MHSAFGARNVLFLAPLHSPRFRRVQLRLVASRSTRLILSLVKYNLIHRKVGAGPGLVLSVLDELRERRGGTRVEK
jgi:hypothetical protein